MNKRADEIGRAYFLDRINFEKGDVIVDCGANIGDLKLYFAKQFLEIEYIGIEPSPSEYECLTKNVYPSQVYNLGLWSEDKLIEFYVASDNADSSFIQPVNFDDIQRVSAKRLDSFFTEKIKLLKLEAEGAEPEVLVGCENILNNINYIAADLGYERGFNQESTLTPVVNFLLTRNFELVDFQISPRISALFKNTLIK